MTQPAQLAPTTTVSIYPNPTKYGIHISFQQWKKEKSYTLQLADNQGRILLVQPLPTSTTWVDFGPLQLVAGPYQLTILEGDQVLQHRALVVSR